MYTWFKMKLTSEQRLQFSCSSIGFAMSYTLKMKLLFNNATKLFASIMWDNTNGAPWESQVASGDRLLYVSRHVFSKVSNTSGLHSSFILSCFKRYEALHKMPKTKLIVFFFSRMSDWFGSFSFSEKLFKVTFQFQKWFNIENLKKRMWFRTVFYIICIIMFALIGHILIFKFTLWRRLFVQNLL